MGVGSEPMPLVGRWAGHPSQALPALAALFPELGFLLAACRQEQPQGLIKPRVEKQSQALMERGQVRNHVWSLEGHSHSLVGIY